LDAALYDLPPGYYEEYLDRIAAVTLAEVNLALAQRLPKDDLLIVVVGTASAIQSQIEQAIPALADSEVVRFDVEV
jgi:predicted Zn-dependent peptidase